MTDLPSRVGVVVRTKNRPWFLRRALDDVFSQTYAGGGVVDVVVVNDGGDQDAVERAVAGVPADRRPRVSVVHMEMSRGRAAAANAGIAALETGYVCLHDDDDLWHPDFLERTVGHLDVHPDDVGVVVKTEIVYETARDGGFVETGRVPMWPGLTDITYSELLHLNRAVPISYLYRRSLHDEIGGYREDLPVVEDWEFNLRTALEHRIAYLGDEVLAFWMQRGTLDDDLGNSVIALSGDHRRYDLLVRDEALRAWVRENGPGLPLYLTRYIQDEVARQLDERRTLAQRLSGAVREWRHDRRRR